MQTKETVIPRLKCMHLFADINDDYNDGRIIMLPASGSTTNVSFVYKRLINNSLMENPHKMLVYLLFLSDHCNLATAHFS